MRILLLSLLLILISCGKENSQPKEGFEPYFQENGWERNNQKYRNGSAVSKHVVFTIPKSLNSWVKVKINIPADRGNSCYYGRILTLDYRSFLNPQKFQVLECIMNSRGYYTQAIIEVYDMRESKVVFDFRGD